MEKYIYEVLNNLNQKRYIGQTTSPTRRFREHKRLGGSEEKEKILYRAIAKYGVENFSFNIIEGPLKNYNEREKYWIKFYNTYVGWMDSWGYNMTEGGEEPPHPKGEDHHYAVHSWDDIEKIMSLLKNTKTSVLEIAKTFNYSRSAIERINSGKIWHIDDIDYPIRKEITSDFKKQRAELIKYDLLNTNLTQKEIGEKYNVGRSTVTAINRGQNFKDIDIDYPIRKTNQQSKPILMLDIKTQEILNEFKDAVEAIKYLGYGDPGGIRACAHGQLKTSLGYIWKFKER